MLSYRRVSILLDKQTGNLLDMHAEKIGISKAKVIKDWIKVSNKINIYNEDNQSKKNMNFNFRLSNDSYDKLVTLVNNSHLSIGQGIRMLILQNSQSELNLKNTFSINLLENYEEHHVKSLWKRGQFSEIHQVLKRRIEMLSFEDLVIYTRVCKELGMLKDAEEGASIMQTRSEVRNERNAKTMQLVSKLMLTDINLYKRDIDKLRSILSEVKTMEPHKHGKGIAAMYYCQMGEDAAFSENYSEALGYYERALDFVDIQHYPTLMTRIYLRIARVNIYNLNFNKAKEILKKAFEIIKILNNSFYYGWIYSDLSLLYLLEDKFDLAKQSIAKSFEYNKSIDCKKGIYYTIDHNARILLFNGELEKAYKLFCEAEIYEKEFRSDDTFSFTKIFKYYIETSYDYNRAIGEIRKLASKTNETFVPSFGKYFLYSAQYLNESEKDEGLRGLRELANSSGNPLIKKASGLTIQRGALSVIR